MSGGNDQRDTSRLIDLMQDNVCVGGMGRGGGEKQTDHSDGRHDSRAQDIMVVTHHFTRLGSRFSTEAVPLGIQL